MKISFSHDQNFQNKKHKIFMMKNSSITGLTIRAMTTSHCVSQSCSKQTSSPYEISFLIVRLIYVVYLDL